LEFGETQPFLKQDQILGYDLLHNIKPT
jgi:hypothetical protein